MKFPRRNAVAGHTTSHFLMAESPFVIKRKSNRVGLETKESKKTSQKSSHGAGGGGGGGGVHRKKSSKTRRAKKVAYPVRRFRQTVPVAGIDYIMQISLTDEKIYQVSKNRIKRNEEPIVEVKANKAQELKDEFASYCGEKKKIKNWLFYV